MYVLNDTYWYYIFTAAVQNQGFFSQSRFWGEDLENHAFSHDDRDFFEQQKQKRGNYRIFSNKGTPPNKGPPPIFTISVCYKSLDFVTFSHLILVEYQ